MILAILTSSPDKLYHYTSDFLKKKKKYHQNVDWVFNK